MCNVELFQVCVSRRGPRVVVVASALKLGGCKLCRWPTGHRHITKPNKPDEQWSWTKGRNKHV
eukprot:6305087-Prorocentrum_lima.AAC.1